MLVEKEEGEKNEVWKHGAKGPWESYRYIHAYAVDYKPVIKSIHFTDEVPILRVDKMKTSLTGVHHLRQSSKDKNSMCKPKEAAEIRRIDSASILIEKMNSTEQKSFLIDSPLIRDKVEEFKVQDGR